MSCWRRLVRSSDHSQMSDLLSWKDDSMTVESVVAPSSCDLDKVNVPLRVIIGKSRSKHTREWRCYKMCGRGLVEPLRLRAFE